MSIVELNFSPVATFANQVHIITSANDVVCWIRKIAGVRRVERRSMKDLREEVGTKACIVGKIVKSRMKWAGHMVRMNDDKLPKRAETKRQEGSRKRGGPQLRWEDCVKRDLRKAKEEEKWREKANNRGRWKQITKVAVPTMRNNTPVHLK